MPISLHETSHLIAHRALMTAWRAKSHDEQLAWFASGSEEIAPFQADTSDRIRVGLCCPCIVQGGAEAWQLALARSVDSTRISWQGVAVVGGGQAIDSSMRTAFAQLMPIATGRDEARRLASMCDVLVTWAVEDLPELVAGLSHPPKTVAVCHDTTESAWGQTVYARARPDRFVAVSELAREAIPAADRAGAALIWNAVDESILRERAQGSGLRTEEGSLDLSPESSVLSPIPALTRPIPHRADGPTLAAAVLADSADREGTLARVRAAQSFARERLSIERFGREWTEFLADLGQSARSLRVTTCPDRGGVLPISMQDDCGCSGKELSECRQGRGMIAGRVTLRDCLVCQGTQDR